MAIPISYIFRDHDEPTDDMILSEYTDSDEELMTTVTLTGEDYLHDNKMVWMILAHLVGSGTAWPFIQHLAPTFDTRKAIKILKEHSCGASKDAAHWARAQAILKKTIYTCMIRFFWRTLVKLVHTCHAI